MRIYTTVHLSTIFVNFLIYGASLTALIDSSEKIRSPLTGRSGTKLLMTQTTDSLVVPAVVSFAVIIQHHLCTSMPKLMIDPQHLGLTDRCAGRHKMNKCSRNLHTFNL